MSEVPLYINSVNPSGGTFEVEVRQAMSRSEAESADPAPPVCLIDPSTPTCAAGVWVRGGGEGERQEAPLALGDAPARPL